jgi:hypothetical protein
MADKWNAIKVVSLLEEANRPDHPREYSCINPQPMERTHLTLTLTQS